MPVVTFRPLEVVEWPGVPTKARRHSQFQSTYEQTRKLLERELGQLSARDVVIQARFTRRDLRADGWPYSDRNPADFPGVIVSFTAKGSPMQFFTDAFVDWRDNLRGIALSLQALRAVERYGCTQGDRQYRGWAQLPPGEGWVPPEPAMTLDEAAELVAAAGGFANASAGAIREDPEFFRLAWQRAIKNGHPDRGGDTRQFQRLEQAAKLLRERHGIK